MLLPAISISRVFLLTAFYFFRLIPVQLFTPISLHKFFFIVMRAPRLIREIFPITQSRRNTKKLFSKLDNRSQFINISLRLKLFFLLFRVFISTRATEGNNEFPFAKFFIHFEWEKRTKYTYQLNWY